MVVVGSVIFMTLFDEHVVVLLTGSGLKDPDTAIARAAGVLETAATIESVESALGWGAPALAGAGAAC